MSSPVEQIKQRLSAVDLIQSYIKIDKAGANYKARCPFHSEKSASFFVSPARDIWHCFGCGKGGDIFAFVMEIEGVEFIEALKILADRAGVKLITEDPRFRNERTRILDLMKSAVDFYRNELSNQKSASDYLHNRGLKDEIIQPYFLGYALSESFGWRNLYEFLLKRGYTDEEMLKSGMVVRPENREKRFYDRFRGRIMFPIFDFSGRAVGFSGRLYPETGEEKMGKYINSPQTILYDKSKILYGFDRAKTEIRKKDACVLVEGQMDVLMSHQAGVLNCVAVSGTGLTSYHLESIRRLTNNLIVCFDSDEAGFIAAGRGIDLALSGSFEVKVISLPFGKDPADVVFKDPSAWQKAVEEASHIIDFYLKILSEKIEDPRELKRKVEQIILTYLSFIESEIDKSHWVSKIAKKLGMREEPVWEQLRKMKLNKIQKENAAFSDNFSGSQKTRKSLLEERLIGIAFWKNDANIISGKNNISFSGKHADLLESFKEKKALIAEDKKYFDRLSFEAELYYGGMGNEQLEKEINIMANDLEKEDIKENLEALTAEIRLLEEKKDETKIAEKLKKFNEFSGRFNQLSKMDPKI